MGGVFTHRLGVSAAAGGGGDPLADLFGSGEVGDLWRFNTANMSLSGSNVLSATGLINALVMTGAGDPQLSSISGNECIAYGGGNEVLLHDFGTIIAQPGTIIFSADVITGSLDVIVGGNDTTNRWQISLSSGSPATLTTAAGASTLTANRTTPIEKAVITVEFNGASSIIRINGVQFATGNLGTAGIDYLTSGAWFDGTSAWAGSKYGMLFIDRLLTTGAGGELDRAERQLGSYGGNTWPAGWWQNMFDGGSFGSNSNGWNGFTWRQRIPAASLTDISGTLVRLGLQAGTTENLTITKAYIGLESGGNFQYASAPTQLTWDGGSASTTITAGHVKLTDAVSLALDGTATVVISLYMNGGTGADTFRFTSTMNGVQTQFKGAVDEAALTGALSGYTAQNAANPIRHLVVS